MSEEKIRKNHIYKSYAETLARKLLKSAIVLAAGSLAFTFFCLFSHTSLDELTEKYIKIFTAFILLVVFDIGWMLHDVFIFCGYRMKKKRIMANGTPTGGRILQSEMKKKRGKMLYSFAVKLESGEFFGSELYNDDYFKENDCKECTVYSHNKEYIISEFIEIVTHKDEKKDEEKK